MFKTLKFLATKLAESTTTTKPQPVNITAIDARAPPPFVPVSPDAQVPPPPASSGSETRAPLAPASQAGIATREATRSPSTFRAPMPPAQPALDTCDPSAVASISTASAAESHHSDAAAGTQGTNAVDEYTGIEPEFFSKVLEERLHDICMPEVPRPPRLISPSGTTPVKPITNPNPPITRSRSALETIHRSRAPQPRPLPSSQ